MVRRLLTAAAITMMASVCWADIIVCDVVGGAATDGFWPNTETRMSMTIESWIAQVQRDGMTVRYVGGGRYNGYDGNVLEGYAIDLASTGGSKQPSSSPTIASSHTLRNSILAPAAPGQDPQERPRSVRHTGLRADIFYNTWKDEAADTKGAVVGINPTIMFGGEIVEFGVTIPIHASIPDTETDEDPIYHAGVDFSLRVWLGNYVSLGMHALYLADMYTVKEDGTDTRETRSTVNGGPFVSARIPFGKVGVLSFAGLLENSYDLDAEDAEVISEVAIAANMGFNLGEVAALNIYGMHHMNLDSELENSDYDEVGVEAQFGGGDTWSFNFGVKTALGIDDYSSIEGYIGSQWRW